MNINSVNSNVSFERRLKPHEKIENRILIQEGKKAIGLENMLLVTHSMSFPSTKNEDTGIGVLSANKGTLSYIDLAYDNGFDGILLEPGGTIKPPYYSPYESSLMSKKVVADLHALTTPKWGKILPKEDFDAIVENKQYDIDSIHFEKNRTIYDYAIPAHKKALEIAYANFNNKLENGDKDAEKINEKFEKFKEANKFFLEKDAVYSILSDIHGNDYYPNWNNPLHINLFDSEYLEYSDEEKMAEYEKIKAQNKDKIDFYMFSQFVVDEQQKELAQYAKNISEIKLAQDVKILARALENGEISKGKYDFLTKKLAQNAAQHKGINLIGDKPVGFSNMDIWANKDLFTTDEFLGAAPNLMKKRGGQAWNFPFVPNEKLFDEEGNLARGGEYMKQVFKKMLRDNPGGLRIDHILGLIDPWTYQNGSEEGVNYSNQGSRYIFKNLLNTSLKDLRKLGFNEETIKGVIDPLGAIYGENKDSVAMFKNNGIEDLDAAKEIVEAHKDEVIAAYSQIIDKILLSACKETALEQAKERGETLNEDEITKQALNLLVCEDLGSCTMPLKLIMNSSGLKGMRHAAYSDPIDPKQRYREGNPDEQGHYWLMGVHDDPPYINQVKKPDFKKEATKEYLSRELGIDKTALKDEYSIARAKVSRMMAADKDPKTPNNVILNWLDLFGKTQQYNTPGLSDRKANWTLRVSRPGENFEKTLYANVLPHKHGVNIDEALAVSMRASNVKNKNPEIYAGLQKYAKIVEEKE